MITCEQSKNKLAQELEQFKNHKFIPAFKHGDLQLGIYGDFYAVLFQGENGPEIKTFGNVQNAVDFYTEKRSKDAAI